jgi:hypothetical protein
MKHIRIIIALFTAIVVVLILVSGDIVKRTIVSAFFKNPPPPPATLVETRPATPLGVKAMTVNGRIQPRGRPTTYWFEYGETTAYGGKTAPVALPPRIGAYYQESWDNRKPSETGLRGWSGGLDRKKLYPANSGGLNGGYVWYDLGAEGAPQDLDQNHTDGIGGNFLTQYAYTGAYTQYSNKVQADKITGLMLGGGHPDFRGARISVAVSGVWPNPKTRGNAELVFWMQNSPNLADVGSADERLSNWAFTNAASRLTDGMLSPTWKQFSYVLENDTNLWTYCGTFIGGPNEKKYVYVPLDKILGDVNADMFHMVALHETVYHSYPYGGRVQFDELTVAYRNKSVLVPSNGGSLVSAPPGDPPERLTDGWRNGKNRTWSSAPNPVGPLEFTYKLANPVKIATIQIHQNPVQPSKDVEVLGSTDDVTYTTLVSGVIPHTNPPVHGPNFDYFLEDLAAPVTASWVKVLVRSGYQNSAWGLGEIEVFENEAFGTLAVAQTDDDWYGVTTDIADRAPGKTYHWRLAAQSAAGVVYSNDATFTIPESPPRPWVQTLAPSRLARGTATFEGRIAPLGSKTTYYFEYGPAKPGGSAPDQADRMRTPGSDYGDHYAGLENTPRTITNAVAGLNRAATYYVWLVATNRNGRTVGDPVTGVTFVAK